MLRYEDCDRASDLRIDKSGHSSNNNSQDERQNVNGNCVTIKQELLPIPSSSSPPLIRRYFFVVD